MKIRPRGLGVRISVSNPVLMKPLGSWNDIMQRFIIVGPKRDPEHHYFEPQGDLVYTPNVRMQRKALEDIDT